MPDVFGFYPKSPYFFLSNYGPGGFYIGGEWYHCNEQWYMVNKTDNPTQKLAIMAAETANDCKQIGKKVTLRSDWEQIKDGIMLWGLRAKFTQNIDLAYKLMDTGLGHLCETNDWHDIYWGVCDGNCKRPHDGSVGQNKLGRALMQVRAELNLKPFPRFDGAGQQSLL